ncbi:hypothetical protein J2T14_003388 [Paenibacillus harenae]|nr:hypothetical protein [Paenibacillus harenae]
MRINLLENWNRTGEPIDNGYDLKQPFKLAYPAPAESVGWYPIGFERGNDTALDAMGWFGFKLGIQAYAEETELTVKASFADGRAVLASAYIAGAGEHEVIVRLSDFEIEAAKNNIWRFLQAIELQGNAALSSAMLVRGDKIFASIGIAGKSGDTGEEVNYAMSIYNCTDARQHVTGKQLFKGWESLIAKLVPSRFVLESSHVWQDANRIPNRGASWSAGLFGFAQRCRC